MTRPVIEATLAELGRVLAAGQTLAVPPLGRARISCEKDARGGDVTYPAPAPASGQTELIGPGAEMRQDLLHAGSTGARSQRDG